jgi:hypothetical protein
VSADGRDPHRHWVERKITQAAGGIREGCYEDTITVLAQLAVAPDTAAGSAARSATELLVRAAADMLCALAERDGRDRSFAVRLTGEDADDVSIDDVDPPVRATIRALLAEANGDRESADIQLDLAFFRPDDAVATTVALQALVWAVGLANTCEEQGVGFPAWLRGSTAQH